MVTIPVVPAFLLASNAASALDKLRDALFNNPFAGIHHLVFFDYAILVPYFSVLVVLSFYGLHRYEMIRGYWKYRKNLPDAPPTLFEQLPRVTVQLPLFNERFVVERLIEETVKLDYPRELLQIQVLDDSTDDTHAFTQRLVGEYRAAGYPIEYIHRSNRHGYKAGALQNGLQTATGEIVAIFDADFVPPVDFLQRTVHYFADGADAVVVSEPALQRPDGSAGDAAGRPFRTGACRTLRERVVFQFQRHGGDFAALHD
jgi:cellulose synthase/poly-beta-1,6-N-acetylglucosamine synthase-like glycosyltransferase